MTAILLIFALPRQYSLFLNVLKREVTIALETDHYFFRGGRWIFLELQWSLCYCCLSKLFFPNCIILLIINYFSCSVSDISWLSMYSSTLVTQVLLQDWFKMCKRSYRKDSSQKLIVDHYKTLIKELWHKKYLQTVFCSSLEQNCVSAILRCVQEDVGFCNLKEVITELNAFWSAIFLFSSFTCKQHIHFCLLLQNIISFLSRIFIPIQQQPKKWSVLHHSLYCQETLFTYFRLSWSLSHT